MIVIGLIATEQERRSLSPEMVKQMSSAFAGIARMLNDHELIARVNKMYYDGNRIADVKGFDWYWP